MSRTQNKILFVNAILRGQRPKKVQIPPFWTITVLCIAFPPKFWGKYLYKLKYILKVSFINYSPIELG